MIPILLIAAPCAAVGFGLAIIYHNYMKFNTENSPSQHIQLNSLQSEPEKLLDTIQRYYPIVNSPSAIPALNIADLQYNDLGVIINKLEFVIVEFKKQKSELEHKLIQLNINSSPGLCMSLSEDNYMQLIQSASNVQQTLIFILNITSEYSFLNQLEPQIQEFISIFASDLEDLHNKVQDYKFKSIAFSIAKFADKLVSNYMNETRQNRRQFSLFNSNIQTSFTADMAFLEKLSQHTQCSDEIRHAYLTILNKKINSPEYQILAKLSNQLSLGLSLSVLPRQSYKGSLAIINNFCHAHDLELPKDLLLFMNTKTKSA